jgi:surface antigen
MLLLSMFSPVAHADRFDNQINQLKQNNAQVAHKQQRLGGEANALSDTVASLRAEATALEAQIAETRAKAAGLQQQIGQAETELAQQRQLLGENLRSMYTEQDMTTLEMLASSHNLSHYVDQEQYREALQTKIDANVQHINQLMTQLTQEKKAADSLLADQKNMEDRLNGQRAESNRLLGLNQNQQQDYQRQIAANNAQLAKARKEQIAANDRGFVRPSPVVNSIIRVRKPQPVKLASTSSASYPWASVPFPNSLPDPWGMYKRQCVSYTAWKVSNSGRHMPYWGGRGDAKRWDDNARSAGIPVDTKPRVGDVAVSNAGSYGHVMYVEAVNGDGTVNISQYNAHLDGKYSEGRKNIAGLVFIHF